MEKRFGYRPKLTKCRGNGFWEKRPDLGATLQVELSDVGRGSFDLIYKARRNTRRLGLNHLRILVFCCDLHMPPQMYTVDRACVFSV